MAHRHALEALNATLQDLRDCSTTMGGVTILLSGDFRQTLPVIPKGTRADEVSACLKSSSLWQSITTLTLTMNMRARLHSDQQAAEFAANLLSLGDGNSFLSDDGETTLCSISTNVNTLEELKGKVFPRLHENYQDLNWLCERAILVPKNSMVNAINQQLVQVIPGRLHVYKSIDSIPDTNQAVNYPVEFLNSLEPPRLPPHILSVKVGTPVMLLRNLSPLKLCNGTRLVIKSAMQHVIEATIISGCRKGEDVFIPMIPLTPSDADIPFQFRRLQFPLRISFAMSINKSQGQTLAAQNEGIQQKRSLERYKRDSFMDVHKLSSQLPQFYYIYIKDNL
ncbi:uncharacterized protein LOC106883770 [Octopus bimaculoides]|uniref:uncharacterized protein LOC106883770 n=1 Tax=Octopus bimaculoides TaxID=37653 RepID=UPI00071C46E4|nr:uncharacterized protein LOC106883770 [Octopus bimaculoides]|eukprot:XP_014790383.1 PREDICTED: uncharacterized protein LOC106883770 [Octopus bimaculoides]